MGKNIRLHIKSVGDQELNTMRIETSEHPSQGYKLFIGINGDGCIFLTHAQVKRLKKELRKIR